MDFRHTSRFPCTPRELFALLRSPRLLPVLSPQGLYVRVLDASDEELRPGSWMRIEARILGLPVRWITFVTDMAEPGFIGFRWVNSPMRNFYHDFRPRADGDGTEVLELFQFDLPFGGLGRRVGRRIVIPRLERLCLERDRRVREFLGKLERPAGRTIPGGRAA